MQHTGADTEGEFFTEVGVIGSVGGQLLLATAISQELIFHEVQVSKHLEDRNTVSSWHKHNLQRKTFL